MRPYGKELILDLHECDPAWFTRGHIAVFFKTLCAKIEMEPCELFWWDDFDVPEEEKQTEPHLKGTSAVQFIMTSNITIHTLDLLGAVYLNIFSCKDFDPEVVKEYVSSFFRGVIVNEVVVKRV